MNKACADCGYPLIHDPGAICEIDDLCGSCGGDSVVDCGCAQEWLKQRNSDLERRHMPDCYMSDPVTVDRSGLCICDRLRACEQRIREDDKNTFLRAAYDTGREDGLDAARETVERCRTDLRGYLNKTDALAAIDALRGER